MPVDKEKTVRTSMIVSSEMYREVQELAAANDVSAAWIMRHALLQFLENHRGESRLPLRQINTRRKEASNGRASKKVG